MNQRRDALFYATQRRRPLCSVLLQLKVNGIRLYRGSWIEKSGSRGEYIDAGRGRGVEWKDEGNLGLSTGRILLAFLRIPLSKWSINYERPRPPGCFFCHGGRNLAGEVALRPRGRIPRERSRLFQFEYSC